MRVLTYCVLVLASLSFFAPLAVAQNITVVTPDAERQRRLRRAAERIELARKLLAEAQADAPELAEALRKARESVKDIDEDTVEIREQGNAVWNALTTAFPWAAPLIAAGGAYAGGRKHGANIERKRSNYVNPQALSPAGRAPGGSATPFTGKAERRPTPQAHPIPVEPSMSEVEGMRDMSTATFEEAMQRKEKG